MDRYSIEEFVNQTQQKDHGQGVFELETERMLELNLNGQICTKMGSMISYRGNVKFTREEVSDRRVRGTSIAVRPGNGDQDGFRF